MLPPLPAEALNAAGPIAKLIDDGDPPSNENEAAPGSGSNTTTGSTSNQLTGKGHSSRMLPKLSTAAEDLQVLVQQDAVNNTERVFSGAHSLGDEMEQGRTAMSNVTITDDDPDAMLIAATYLMEESGQDHFRMITKASNNASGPNENQYKGKNTTGKFP